MHQQQTGLKILKFFRANPILTSRSDEPPSQLSTENGAASSENRSNIGKHGTDFADAWEIFQGPMLTSLDTREDYGEDRWIAVGFLRSSVVVAVYAERKPGVVRIISAPKALQHERKQFEKALRDRLV